MFGRGARAWENFDDGLGQMHPEVTRLLTHATADSTIGSTYLPNVRKVLERWLSMGVSSLTVEDLDRLLAKEFDRLCYSDGLGPSKGVQIFNRVLAAFPEMNGSLPRANRSVKSWSKLQPGNERGPMPEEAVLYGVEVLLAKGRIYPAWIALLSMDCYLRSQDWRGLVGADISYDRRGVALVFGRSTRGESSKGGPNQGVVVARGWIAEGMIALARLVDPHSAVFPMSSAGFRALWQRVWEAEGCGFVRAIHELRHTGASEDIARARRDREGVRRRGRWRHISSTDRYTKTHLLTEARAKFGSRVIERGQMVMENPRQMLASAIRRGPGAKTAEGRAVLAIFDKGPRVPDSIECIQPGVESPRIEPMPRLREVPERWLDMDISRRGLSVPRGRKQKEEVLAKAKFVVSAESGGLSDTDGATDWGRTSGSASEREDEGRQLGYAPRKGRRRVRKTARAKAFV